MLFPYAFLPEHSIYKMQEWIDRIFLDVWCAADPGTPYSLELLPEEIQEVVLEIFRDDRVQTDYLYGPIQKVYEVFRSLDARQRAELAERYRENNDIERLCGGSADCRTTLFPDLRQINPELPGLMKEFFTNLFESVIHLKCVQRRLGTIDGHYKAFRAVQRNDVCPICGLSRIASRYESVREAYDHYLPKSLYPFNSINFRNLVPMCHKCNSGYKGTSDPLHRVEGTRRPAFYLYSEEPSDISIQITIRDIGSTGINGEAIELELVAERRAFEVETWNEVFDIRRRYIAACADEGEYWIESVFEAAEVYGISPDEALRKQLAVAKNHPFMDENFLKAPFLEACEGRGIFARVQESGTRV